MNPLKVRLMRALLALVYWFLLIKYREVERVFILHDTKALVVTEDEFWGVVSGGGTHLSSGVRCALEEIEEKYDPRDWNIYAVQFSDGENENSDNEDYRKAIRECLKKVVFFGYVEVQPGLETTEEDLFGSSSTVFSKIHDLTKSYHNFSPVLITSFPAVGQVFLKLFKAREEFNR